MVNSTPEEKKMFRVTPMHYVVFDEAHMLKNMNTQRYESLIKIRVIRIIVMTQRSGIIKVFASNFTSAYTLFYNYINLL